MSVRIDLLFWEGCPSHPQALADLRAALAELGREADVRRREVRTPEEAQALGFPGSPTLQVDGRDLFPSADPPGLTCRIYHRRDGRVSPVPDPDDLRAALQGILGG